MSDKFWEHYPIVLLTWYQRVEEGKAVPNLYLWGSQGSGKTMFCEAVKLLNKDLIIIEDVPENRGFNYDEKYLVTADHYRKIPDFLHIELKQIKEPLPYIELY